MSLAAKYIFSVPKNAIDEPSNLNDFCVTDTFLCEFCVYNIFVIKMFS